MLLNSASGRVVPVSARRVQGRNQIQEVGCAEEAAIPVPHRSLLLEFDSQRARVQVEEVSDLGEIVERGLGIERDRTRVSNGFFETMGLLTDCLQAATRHP